MFFGITAHGTRLTVYCLLFTAYCLLAAACATAVPQPPTPLPTATPGRVTEAAPTPLPSATPAADTGWEAVQPGLERRVMRLWGENGRLLEEITLLRLQPARFRWEIAYRPGAPLTLAQWRAETGALLLVNGGYFTETFHATGLIIVDGQAQGPGYGDFAGMLAITEDGPELRWLRERPYDPAERLRYGLQSFPLLVRPGGVPGFPNEDGVRARRTVIARDGDGRILFLVAPLGHFTLHELSRFLLESDLNVDVALNLDGGTSSGMALGDGVVVPAFTAVPAVIAVYER